MKQVQDTYFRKAKREGFVARSVYKLEEIDRRRRLLKPGLRVLDLGAAPGSWLQYAAERVGPRGAVLGVDLRPVTARLPDHATSLETDVFTLTPEMLETHQPPFDVILSDMAPNTTGIPSVDAARSAELVMRSLELCGGLLKPGGALLAKVFQGAALDDVRRAFGQAFAKVSLEKPRASRKESVEIYLLGLGRRG